MQLGVIYYRPSLQHLMQNIKQEDNHTQHMLHPTNKFTHHYQQGKTDRKKEQAGLSLFRSNASKEIEFGKPDWLETICSASNIQYTHMLEWTQEIQKVINNQQSSLHVESLSKIEFKNVQTKKQTYYLNIKAFASEIVCCVLRDNQGDIILYQTIQQNTKIQFVLNMLQRYSLNNWLIVLDETGSCSDCSYLLQDQHIKYKFAYVLTSPISEQLLAEMDQQFTFQSMNNISVFYPKSSFKSIATVQQNICKLYGFQHQEASRFQLLFGQSILSYYPDRFFFLTKTISQKMKVSSSVITSPSIANYLHLTCNYLKESLNRRGQFANSHFPKRGETKTLCCFCSKKKTEAVCEGCLTIQNKTRYLCIGDCYRRYHQYISILSSSQQVQVSTNIEYFDQKCRQLEQTIGELLKLQNGSQLLQSFIEMSSSKVVTFLNLSSQRRLQSGMQAEWE